MKDRSFLVGLFGFPIIVVLLLIGISMPAYVPSDILISAAASTSSSQLARDRMIESFVGRCRKGWNLTQQGLLGTSRLYSWENDAGFLARTEIVCTPGQRCTVTAQALFDSPFPEEINGKPLHMRSRCRATSRRWRRQPAY